VERINVDAILGFREVVIAMEHDGSYIIVWEGGTRSNEYKIIAQRFKSDDTSLNGNFRVSTSVNPFIQIYPSVALHKRKIYTAWNSVEDSLFKKIYGPIFLISITP
jgi:hypothetical protein